MNLTGIDHFVLTVEDIETTCLFYSDVLDAEIVTFGEDRKALQFGDQKINLHPAGNGFKPKAAQPTPGAGDFCIITDTAIETVESQLYEAGAEIIEGPVERTGAGGQLMSVYIRDPDGNLVEIAEYQ